MPPWLTLVVCCGFGVWACLWLYDYQHEAAAAARGLWSVNASARLAAVRALEGSGRVDPEVAIPALIRGLKDTDLEVRLAAAEALVCVVPGAGGGPIPSKEDLNAALATLVAMVRDPQPSVRAAATRALWMVMLVNQAPPAQLNVVPATDALIDGLEDSDPSVRLAAIQGLGAVGPRFLGVPPPELVAAIEDQSEKTRNAAVEALAVFYQGLPPLVPSLVDSAERASPQARASYVKLFGRIRPRSFSADAVPSLITALTSLDQEIVTVAAADLNAFAEARSGRDRSPVDTAVPPLIDTMERLNRNKADDRPVAETVVAIADVLGKLAPETSSSDAAVAALAMVVRGGDTRCRVAAVKALGRFPASGFLRTTLSSIIGDHDEPVRLAALNAIHDVNFGPDFVIPRSMVNALDDPSAAIRAAAAGVLGRGGQGIDLFVPILFRRARNDPDGRVREICAGTLAHLGATRAVSAAVLPDLIQALASSDATLRFLAGELLAGLGDHALPAVPALVASLARPDSTKPWANPGVSAAKALAQIAPGTSMAGNSVNALLAALVTNDVETKNAAADALAAFGLAAAPAVPRLAQVLKAAEDEKDSRLTISSAATLARIAPRDAALHAIETLRKLAEQGSPYFRDAAARALKNIEAKH